MVSRVSDYMFSGAKENVELQRLDDQHNGIGRYMDGRLSFAPLADPAKFLELGCGTGAWAIQAAFEFPDAEIFAADMSPLPNRPLPPNVKFHQLNLLDTFPWEGETFDVIHMRLLLYHIPEATTFVHRAVKLLKPGGWLLIEDTCLIRCPHSAGPAQLKRNEITSAFMISKGLDPDIGAHLAQIIRTSGLFDEHDIHVQEAVLPFSPLPDDPAVRSLAETMRQSVIRATTRSLSADLRAAGMTAELQDKWASEMDDMSYDPTQHFFFVWACKASVRA